MIKAVSLVNDRVEEVDIKLLSVGKYHCWIDVVDPTIEELRSIHEKCAIPLSELQHSLDPDERPRVKVEKDYIFLIYRTPQLQEKKSTAPLTIFLGKRLLITLHKQKIPAINDIDLNSEVMKTLFKESPEFLLYKIFHGLSREAAKLLEEVEEELERIEADAIKRATEHVLAHLFTLKKKILYLRRAFIGDRDVLSLLLKDIPQVKEKGLFAEIEVELMQSCDTIEVFRERLTSIVEIYMTNTSNRINMVMKSITVIATMLAFPIMITGLYGMNVALPLDEHPYAFWIITGLILVSIVVAIVIFSKKKWL